MHTIFINDTPLYLKGPQEISIQPNHVNLKNPVAKYNKKIKHLLQYIDMLEKNDNLVSVTLYSDDPETLWNDFKSLYKIIEAAGGLVKNDKNELLLIYRLHHWDLPKGKVDDGETTEQAALREIEEETGLVCTIRDFHTNTWHTYKDKKGKRILKNTYWYNMNCDDISKLALQTEENITDSIWWDHQTSLSHQESMYNSIKSLLL